MGPVVFTAELISVKSRSILRLPEEASKALPSRGQVAVTGELAGQAFETVLEPDGEFGHWMNVGEALQRAAGVRPGDAVAVRVEVRSEWPEPVVPADLAAALKAASPRVSAKWADITPMARWEWVRWVNETRNPATRVTRIEKTVSKLEGEHRRPCCFNLAACTDPELSRSARLVVDPSAPRP